MSTEKILYVLWVDPFQILIGVALVTLFCKPDNFDDDDRLDDEEQIANYLDNVKKGNVQQHR